MIQQMHPLFRYGRLLFVVDTCQRCAIWKEFIEVINSRLYPDKRIEVINCTPFHDYGIITDNRIPMFMPYIQGEYPVLFFEGRRKDGTNTRLEAEAWIRAKVHDDFIIEEHNPYLFHKKCQFVEKGIFKNKIICN